MSFGLAAISLSQNQWAIRVNCNSPTCCSPKHSPTALMYSGLEGTNSVEVSHMYSGGLYDLWHMVWEIEIAVEHHSEVPDTLCWRDLVSQNIDREVRDELFTIFWEPLRMNSVLSGVSFNLLINMKFWMSFRQFFSFCIEKFSGLVQRENRIGPRTEPLGTPTWSSAGCESVLPTLTKCVLYERYDLN